MKQKFLHVILSKQQRISRLSSSFHSRESTIYALATGGVRNAVAVVRVSGPSAGKVLQDIGQFKKFPQARIATVKKLFDIQNGALLDNAMVLWFPGPHSYTGEDCCEFHVHGGPAVVTGILKTISLFKDCRMAEPGEFTRRAFVNGKMDLTEIDGLGDLIAAETEMQKLQALNQMSGSLGKLYESWRDRIAKCLANVEAYIDFGEDENIEADILETVEKQVNIVIEEIKAHIQDEKKGERLRSGVLVAILGKPNVGKSSLLNLLCKREAAIVSDIPGTTRDVVQATININGYPVILADTAGIRKNPGDVIETEGIRRALKEATKADIVVLLLDLTDRVTSQDLLERKDLINEEIRHFLHQEEIDGKHLEDKVIVIKNKSDLSNGKKSLFDCTISCKTLQGYEDFLNLLGARVSSLCANPKSEQAYITQERYRSHLENCISHLNEYKNNNLTRNKGEIDFALQIIPLKDAMNSIGCITGHYGTEEILDIIFRDFCIGK